MPEKPAPITTASKSSVALVIHFLQSVFFLSHHTDRPRRAAVVATRFSLRADRKRFTTGEGAALESRPLLTLKPGTEPALSCQMHKDGFADAAPIAAAGLKPYRPLPAGSSNLQCGAVDKRHPKSGQPVAGRLDRGPPVRRRQANAA